MSVACSSEHEHQGTIPFRDKLTTEERVAGVYGYYSNGTSYMKIGNDSSVKRAIKMTTM